MSDYDTATRFIYLQRERAKKARDAKDDKIKGGNFFTILEDYPAPEVWPEVKTRTPEEWKILDDTVRRTAGGKS